MDPASLRRLNGVILAATGASLFSLKGVIMKLGFLEGVSVEQMMALRMGMALPIFAAVGILAARRPRLSPEPVRMRHYAYAAGLGILSYYVCTWLDFTGLQFISAQLERLLLFLYPTVTALLAWIFLGDRITWRHGAALAISYAGVAILFGRELTTLGPHAALGAALVFTAAVLFAGYVTASKAVIARLGPPLFTSVAMSAAAVAILAHVGIASAVSEQAPLTPMSLGLGAIMALACTVAPSFMMAEAISRIGPGQTAAVGGVGPVTTAGVAVLLLGEPFGLAHAAALVLTVGGVLLLATAQTGAPKTAASEPAGAPR